MLRSVVFVLLYFFILNGLYAQRLLIENRGGIGISYNNCINTGPAIIQNGSFRYPGLFSNMHKGQEISLMVYRKIYKPFYLGIQYGLSHFSSWHFEQKQYSSNVYDGVRAGINSLSFNLLVRSPFRQRGLFNKFRILAGISPGIYYISVHYPNPFFQQVDINGNSEPVNVYSKSLKPGISFLTILECSISNNWAFTVNAGYQFIPVTSYIFSDKSVKNIKVGVGFQFRIMKNKNYLHQVYE